MGKIDKWHAICGVVGTLLATAVGAVLNANQISIADHWADMGLGISAAVGALFGAYKLARRGTGTGTGSN